jgi:Holliday junction resolvase RusA-like endonuclease
MPAISFNVDGIPKGQPRPKAFSRGGIASVYDPGTAEGWKGCIVMAGRDKRPETPIEQPITLKIVFYMPRPKSMEGKKFASEAIPCTKKPDADNMAKAVMDCLTQDGWWRDDSYVYRLVVVKNVAAKGARPGAVVEIEY